MSWYNESRVSQPGSVILNAWMKGREQQRVQNSAQVPATEITRGSDMYDFFAGGQVAGVSINEKTAMRVSKVRQWAH
jgi:hypothetical protein